MSIRHCFSHYCMVALYEVFGQFDQAAGSSYNNEVSTLQALKLSTNPWQLVHVQVEVFATHESDAEFSMRVYLQNLAICNFLKTTTNLSYDSKYCPFSDHTNVICDLQLLSLVQTD